MDTTLLLYVAKLLSLMRVSVDFLFFFFFFPRPLFQSVHGATRKTLSKIKGFSEVKVEKVKEAVQKCLVRYYHHGAGYMWACIFFLIKTRDYTSHLLLDSSLLWNWVIKGRRLFEFLPGVSSLIPFLRGGF